MYMEISQGNSLNLTILNKQKCCFVFYKNEKQESRTDLVSGVGTSGSGKDVEKGCRRVNMVQILCTPVCKWKHETY
jgi:hypothetical protein